MCKSHGLMELPYKEQVLTHMNIGTVTAVVTYTSMLRMTNNLYTDTSTIDYSSSSYTPIGVPPQGVQVLSLLL